VAATIQRLRHVELCTAALRFAYRIVNTPQHSRHLTLDRAYLCLKRGILTLLPQNLLLLQQLLQAPMLPVHV
jgi:hypothetical protein